MNKNTPKNNSLKFQNIVKDKKTAKEELDDWISKNTDSDVKFVSYDENIITLSMGIGDKNHIIEIVHPKSYPNIKKGFSCREISVIGLAPLNIIPKIKEQFDDKILSVERVLSHLVSMFNKYKSKKIENYPNLKQNSVPHVIFENDKQNDNSSNTEFNIMTSIPESIEMINKMLNENEENDKKFIMLQNEFEKDISEINPIRFNEQDFQEICVQPTESTELTKHELSIDPVGSGEKDFMDTVVQPGILQSAMDPVDPVNCQNSENLIDAISQTVKDIFNEFSENIETNPTNPTNQIKIVETFDFETSDKENGGEYNVMDMINKKLVENISQQINEIVPNLEETKSEIVSDEQIDTTTTYSSSKIFAQNSEKILTNSDFDEFVTKQNKILNKKYPNMGEDEIMDIIQQKWNKNKSKNEAKLPVTSTVPVLKKNKILPKKISINKVNKVNKINKLNDLLVGKPKKPETTDKTIDKTTDDEIDFFDSGDSCGLYLDLSKYTKTKKLPFDMDKLFENAKKLQEEMDFGNSSKVKKTFNPNSAIRVIINEFKKVYLLGLRNHYNLSPINDNVYYLKLKFNKEFFDSSSKIYNDIDVYNKDVEITIQIDSKLYPFYPPRVKLISPRLNNYMNGRIATMDCLLLSKWNPLYNIETIINCFRDLMNKYAEIDPTLENYNDLENDLIELSLLSEIPPRINTFLAVDSFEDLKTNSVQQDKSKKTAKKYWASGTGYGHSGLSTWNVKSTTDAQKERDKQLYKCVKNITKHLTKIIINNVNVDAVGIIKNSCYIPFLRSIFYGNNMLELLKNPTQFESILDSLRIMTKKFIPIFGLKDGENKSLFEIFTELNDDCKTHLKTIEKLVDKNNMTNANKKEFDLLSNFINFYKKLQQQIKMYDQNSNDPPNSLCLSQNVQNVQNVQNGQINRQVLREIYKIELKDELCKEYDNMNLNAFNKLINGSDAKVVSNQLVMQISKEISSNMKSMPLEFESSIFYRYNSLDIKYHEFIITGPEGTPYDSGCFHFRMYCPSNYPNKNPAVNIYTTGNGSVSFNPNLYSNGKVCLSLLGTWSADTGEKWIPGTSTMLQIMVSIQSLVLIPYPYFNEPGSESSQNTENGMNYAKQYNHDIRLNCMKWAMVDMIKNPTKGFENAILTHFKLKAEYIKEMCREWISDSASSNSKLISDFKSAYIELCKELDKLTNKTGTGSDDAVQTITASPKKNRTRKTFAKKKIFVN
ncbi:MAG: ubiquitin-conjugating enzyme E2 [Satyrvirus sp.]|uniref:E2 ubiquitin-conjugating enzyme n=1 Tax=Satyrvirus sp. TaxID=2487771 RepID=A0A3G5AEY2_9VIRU|nr:MAG: ubiquitin-conjugating enzyme E2 [Satyrvirus sp.]